MHYYYLSFHGNVYVMDREPVNIILPSLNATSLEEAIAKGWKFLGALISYDPTSNAVPEGAEAMARKKFELMEARQLKS